MNSTVDRIDRAFSAAAQKNTASVQRKAFLQRLLVKTGAAITTAVMLILLLFILANGLPHISPDLFAWEYTSTNLSLMPALINTLLMIVLALGMAVPVGVGSAIYLSEYARKGNRFVRVVRATTEVLAGIPSIIYGLFGLLFFVTTLKWGLSMLAGAATLALMVLPVLMRTTEEALQAVPASFREGSFGLGAGRLHTVVKVVLPSALPGIFGGVVLSMGRVVGEVAALIYTAGTVAAIPDFAGVGFGALFDSTRTLAVHMYVLASEGLHIEATYATAVVLLVVVVGINLLSSVIAKNMTRSN